MTFPSEIAFSTAAAAAFLLVPAMIVKIIRELRR
jgi:hypothetical protein